MSKDTYDMEKIGEVSYQRFHAIIRHNLVASESLPFQASDVNDLFLSLLQDYEAYFPDINLEFLAGPQLKLFAIALRDTYWETCKATLKCNRGLITTDQLQAFYENSFHSLLVFEITELNFLPSDTVEDPNLEELSPWSTLKEQINKIGQQVYELETSYHKLSAAYDIISQIKEQIIQSLSQGQKKLDYLHKTIDSLAHIEASTANDFKALFHKIKAYHQDVQNIENPKNDLDLVISKLSKELPPLMNIPVSTNAGELVVYEYALSNKAYQWLQLEVLPLLNEYWELQDELEERVKSAAYNLSNRIQILTSEDINTYPKRLVNNVYQSLLKKQEITEIGCNKLNQDVLDKLSSNFDFDLLLQSDPAFCASKWTSATDLSNVEQSPIIKTTKRWYNKGISWVNKYLQKGLNPQHDNISEQLIDYILDTELDKHSDYNSIFLTKTFSGKTFYIRRAYAHKVLEKSLHHWGQGYRGSVLVYGNRYSGKTSFLEAAIDLYSDHTIVALRMGQEIEYNGRKHFIDENLEEALAFLQKWSRNEKIVLIIDDLCLREGSQKTVLQNLKALIKLIDFYNQRFFVIASLDKVQYRYFNQFLPLAKSFNSLVDLSKVDVQELTKIIDIRHGTTHKHLIGEDDQPYQPEQFGKLIRAIHKEAEDNVGDALRIWALSIKEYKEDLVKFDQYKTQRLPDFLDDENTVLLKAVYLYREISEYQLRKILGPSFSIKFKSRLERLINTGVLIRGTQGGLSVRESLVNQLAEKLNSEAYL